MIDFSRSGPSHIYLSLEYLHALSALLNILEVELQECKKLVISILPFLIHYSILISIFFNFLQEIARLQHAQIDEQAQKTAYKWYHPYAFKRK